MLLYENAQVFRQRMERALEAEERGRRIIKKALRLEEEKQNAQEALEAVKENLHQNAPQAVKEALNMWNDPKVLEALKIAWDPLRQNAQKTLQAVKEEPEDSEEGKEEKKLYMVTRRFKRLRLCSNDESNPQHTRLAIQCGHFTLANGWITHDDDDDDDDDD